jgi:MFS family permease
MSKPTPYEIDRSQRKLGPIWLSAGIKPRNVIALFYACAMTIVFVTTLGLLHPYLLHEHLKMPTEIQGDFTGNLTVMTEIAAILVVVLAGLLSDRFGRRPLYVGGFLIVCASYVLLPLVRTPAALIMTRILLAVGLSTCLMMLASVIADYPQNASRGKLISINGVITGLGVLFLASLLFAQLPKYFSGRGAAPMLAGTYTYWLVGAAALVTALLAQVGLKGGHPTAKRERLPLLNILRAGIGEVRKNPRLGLTCAAYFVSRGDLAIFVFFFSLWIVAVGTDAGIPVADAQSAAGRLFGVSQLAMLIFTPVMGVIVDRFDRVTALAIGMAIARAGFLALGLVGDPFSSPWIYPVAILGGAGEACVVVSGPALVGQEAPAKIRGAIIGMVGLFGAIGVLIHSKMAGLLFDVWTYQAPFVYMAAFNAIVCVGAILVRIRYGTSRATAPSPAGGAAAAMRRGQPALAADKSSELPGPGSLSMIARDAQAARSRHNR